MTTQRPKRPKQATASRKAKPDATDWTWADPKSLKVKPEFQRLIPLQSKEEYGR